MKITCLQENLFNGLLKNSHLTGNIKSSLPILGNILLKAEKGLIYLISTDLEIAIQAKVRGKIEKEGRFTVPAQLFTSHISFLPNEAIEIELIKDELVLKYKNGQTKIKGIKAEDFPIIPQIEKKEKFVCRTMDFKKTIQKVIFTINAQETRMEISGALLSFNSPKAGFLTFVGTDSYRLAEKSIEFSPKNNNKSDKKIEIIVPSKTLTELLRILDQDQEILEIFLSENQILFSINGTEITSRLISAEFPNYQQIIPQGFKTKAVLDRLGLIKAIKGLSPFSKTGINDISFKFFPQKQIISLFSLNAQVGESQFDFKAEIAGEKNELTFNFRYLLDGLVNFDSSEISLEVTDEDTPAVFKEMPEGNYLYLVMPIRQ